jgi:hypothetical protein
MGSERKPHCLTSANWKLCESEGGGFQRVFLTRGSRRTQRAIFEDEAIGDDEETLDEVLLREVRFASKRLAIGDPKACRIADQREALRVKRAREKATRDQAELERAELERRLTIAVSTIDMTRAAILPAIMNAIKPKAKRVSPGSSGISACGRARVAIVQCGTNDTYEYIFEDRSSASSEPHTLKMFLASLRCWSGNDIKDIDDITHEEWGVRRFPCPAGFTPDGLEVLVLAEEANNFVCIDECASSPQIFRVPLGDMAGPSIYEKKSPLHAIKVSLTKSTARTDIGSVNAKILMPVVVVCNMSKEANVRVYELIKAFCF